MKPFAITTIIFLLCLTHVYTGQQSSIEEMKSYGLFKVAEHFANGLFDILDGDHKRFIENYLANPDEEFKQQIINSSEKFKKSSTKLYSLDVVAYHNLSIKSFVLYYIANTDKGPYGIFLGGFAKDKGVFVNTIAIESNMFKIVERVDQLKFLNIKPTFTPTNG